MHKRRSPVGAAALGALAMTLALALAAPTGAAPLSDGPPGLVARAPDNALQAGLTPERLSVAAGDDVAYRLTIGNAGPDPLTGIRVTGTGFTCGRVFGSLAPGSSAEVGCTHPPVAADRLRAQLSVDSDQTAPTTSNETEVSVASTTGAVAGVLTDAVAGTPIPAAWVFALRALDYTAAGQAVSDATGEYRLDLADGTYYLYAVDPTGDHQADFLGAPTAVAVAAGASTTVDIALTATKGAVAGTIREDGSGTPLPNAWAVATTIAGEPIAAAPTDGAGRFRLSDLPPGAYRIITLDPEGAHRPEFHANTPDPRQASAVRVTAGATATADASLAPTPTGSRNAHITGKVTGTSGAALEGIFVAALRADTFELARASVTDGTGHYDLGLAVGAYRLVALDRRGRHATEWYLDRPYDALATATSVTAPAGVDLQLEPTTGSIGGRVTDDPAGVPLAGALALALGANGIAGGATTTSDGTYQIADLTPGSYRIALVGRRDVHSLEYWPDRPDLASASWITVAAGAQRTVDAALTIRYASTTTSDLAYRTASDWHGNPVTLHLDVYRPVSDDPTARPLLVFVYGGGWCYGDKQQLAYAAMHYAQLGYVTASIDYRMRADQLCSFPDDPGAYLGAMQDSTDDLLGALAYLRADAAEYGIDTARIASLGWSAGGTTSLRQELAGYAGIAQAIVSASGILPEAMGPLGTALRPALMINYEDDDGFVNYVPDPGADCARIVASGGDCTLHLLPGTGHAVDFVEQAPIVLPFLSRVLGQVTPPG